MSLRFPFLHRPALTAVEPSIAPPAARQSRLSRIRSSSYWPSDWFRPAIGLALLLGILVRAFHVLSFDFPLNDGGLFYAMTEDLQDNGYALPGVTSYNASDIPFAYPPLGFYAAALVDDLTPLSLIDAFRFVPLIVTCATLPAFFLLSRSMLSSRLAIAAAVFAFALMPRSFIWLLMGGGVTRSFGLLFALLALYQLKCLYDSGSRRHVVMAALFYALTLLSHLETAWFLTFSSVLFFLAYGRTSRYLILSAVVAAGAFLLTAPWWGQVVLNHGLEPFLAAQDTGGSILSGGEARMEALRGLLRIVSTSEPFFPILGTLGILGAIISIATRRIFLSVWWLAIVLLDLRAFPTFTTLPVALLAGVGFSEVLVPALRRGVHATRATSDADAQLQWPLSMRAFVSTPVILAICIVVYALAGSLIRHSGYAGEAGFLTSLTPAERTAMRWVSNQIPADKTFLVVPDSSWETAKVSEWFPVLTGRRSVATVQGAEWLPHSGFERQLTAYDEALECGYHPTDCLATWVRSTGLSFDYIYLSKSKTGQCCDTLIDSLRQDPAYRLIYDDRGATIYARMAVLARTAAAP